MHVRRAVALTLAVPLLLAGCTEEEPTPDMPDPPTPSATTPATESETTEAESPEEFIRRWVQAGDEMQVTGDTAVYAAMTPKCQPCQAFVRNVRDVYDGGGNAQFAGSTILQIKREGDAPPTFALTKDVPKTIINRPDGAVETLPRGRTTIVVTLERNSSDEYAVTHFVVRS